MWGKKDAESPQARLSFTHRSSLQFFSLLCPSSLKSPMSHKSYSILSHVFLLLVFGYRYMSHEPYVW